MLESTHSYKIFMAALIETDQRHIFNFISKSLGEAEFTDCRILTAVELNRNNRNLFSLIKLIDPSLTFLDSLLREGCITKRHRERIDAQQTPSDKNKELLTIMKRRSYEDFKTFKRVIQTTQRNGKVILKLFKREFGHVINAHCVINIEPEATVSMEGMTELESRISSRLTDPTIFAQEEVTSQLNGLHEVGIGMIGATPTGSVIVYFSCQTFQSIVDFKQMVENGELARILEELFNLILGLSTLYTRFNFINHIFGLPHVTLIVSLSKKEYQSCIREARRTMHSKALSFNQQMESNCYIRHLPRELLELLLFKSIVNCMSEECQINAADTKSVSGSYNLYETISNKTWISANIRFKSVAYEWMHVRNMNRGVAMKQFVLARLHEQCLLFVEQLNCRYVLLDCLAREGIITEGETKRILGAGDDVATRTYEDIQESCWPQMRESEIMINSNKTLLKCLFEKKYSQISKFLRLMDDLCLIHILNHFIDSEGSQSFGDVWPLPYARRSNVIKCGTAIMENMNILALPGERGKREKNEAEFEHHPVAQNRENLIDLLYHKGCISLLQKQHIEQHKTQQLQNLEMFQLIINGSIKTFKVALEFFQMTNQSDVHDMLNRKYIREEIRSPGTFHSTTKESKIAVAWLEGRTYVTGWNSLGFVYIYHDTKSSILSKNEQSIELEGMQNPCDMVASQISRSIFISESDNRYLWMIKVPDLKKFRVKVDGKPYNMSIGPTDVLIVCVVRDDRNYLNLYRSSDGMFLDSIPLPTETTCLTHAIQLLNRNFVISYSKVDDPDLFLISELSSDGMNIIRNINPRSFHKNPMYYWNPCHLTMDEDGNIFIADNDNDSVVLMNSRWTDFQLILNRVQHAIEFPRRLYYVQKKQQLIVSQGVPDMSTQTVSTFDLHFIRSPFTGHLIYQSEIKLSKLRSSETVQVNTNRTKEGNRMPENQLVKRFEVVEESSVVGVTRLENKIYVIHGKSNKVHVFHQEPFEEMKEKEIKIEGMTDPWDISASKVSRTIFISDNDNRCLWKFHTSNKTVSRWEMDGRPETLSITPSDELLVVVDREDHHDLIIFRCLDVNRAQSIPLPSDVKKIAHAVQSTDMTIFISYSTKDFPDVFQISELSRDRLRFVRSFSPQLVRLINAATIIRSFNPRSVGWMNMTNWRPSHLAFDEEGNLFVADYIRHRVYWLNSQLTDLRVILNTYKHNLYAPHRLCYFKTRKRHQLIVGQEGLTGTYDNVFVFNLRYLQTSKHHNTI